MTLATIDPAWLAELTAELATYGYKVTKARVTRGTSTAPASGRSDGAEPVKLKASKRHNSCAAHFRVPGMREAVCIAPDRDESGAPIAAEWSDADTVLAFAIDVGARAEQHRTRASIGYVPADQSGAVLPYPSTFSAELARKVTEQYRMRKVPHAFMPRNGYQYATECETCTIDKHAAIHSAEQVA